MGQSPVFEKQAVGEKGVVNFRNVAFSLISLHSHFSLLVCN